MLPTTETEQDEQNAQYFYSGWKAAIKEAELQYKHGRLEEFFAEQKLEIEGK